MSDENEITLPRPAIGCAPAESGNVVESELSRIEKRDQPGNRRLVGLCEKGKPDENYLGQQQRLFAPGQRLQFISLQIQLDKYPVLSAESILKNDIERSPGN